MSETKESINAETSLYGIFGNPVTHSLSPLMHNAAFSRFQMNSVYLAFPIEEHSLGLAFEGIRSLEIKGVNITIPFKEQAVEFIDEIPEDLDRSIGALNTVVNRKGILYGYNTDALGFLTSLNEDLNFRPEGKSILILGAGGAARGISFALAYAHADKILIHNRTPERSEGLTDYLSGSFPATAIEPLRDLSNLKNEKIDLVVNATSCGMKGNDSLPMDLRQFEHAVSVYDLVYAPSETRFLKEAKKLGFANANGLGMLVNQGALSFELWTGQKEGVRQCLREALKTCLK